MQQPCEGMESVFPPDIGDKTPNPHGMAPIAVLLPVNIVMIAFQDRLGQAVLSITGLSRRVRGETARRPGNRLKFADHPPLREQNFLNHRAGPC